MLTLSNIYHFFHRIDNIDKNGYFVFESKEPFLSSRLILVEKNSEELSPFIDYVVPHEDVSQVLMSINLIGDYKYAKLYMLSCIFEEITIDEVVFDKMTLSTTLHPFIYGIPFAQIGNPIRLRVEFGAKIDCYNFKASGNFGYLNQKNCNELMQYRRGNVGCKLYHSTDIRKDMIVLHPELYGEKENHLDVLYE